MTTGETPDLYIFPNLINFVMIKILTLLEPSYVAQWKKTVTSRRTASASPESSSFSVAAGTTLKRPIDKSGNKNKQDEENNPIQYFLMYVADL